MNNRKSKKQETIHNIAYNITEGKVGSITPAPFPYQSDPESEHVKLPTHVKTGFGFVDDFYTIIREQLNGKKPKAGCSKHG